MIRKIQEEDHDELVQLIAQFRVTMSRLKGKPEAIDLVSAEIELGRYDSPDFRIFVADFGDDGLVGYLVCQIADGAVSAISMFVRPEYRRQGIGSSLYEQAEELVEELNGDTVYNWIQPNNERMIRFLQRRGYNVLNRIELRGGRPGESQLQRIKVGKDTFEYCC